MHIVIVCGTNRTGALSQKLADIAAADYKALGHDVDLLSMADLPADIMSGDAYKTPSAELTACVQRFTKADGVVFIIPEYNGSYPGVLKLFVDMLPYPEGFDCRPCAFIGLAAGQYKSLRAVEHFQQVCGYRNAHQFHRRVFIGDSYTQFAKDGSLTDNELAERLQQQAAGFVEFIGNIK